MSNDKQIEKHLELPHQETIVGINTIQTKPFDNQKITKMSNNKQSMKLYTEEHLKIFYHLGKINGFVGRQDDVNELIKNYPPIELPNDEEMVSIKNVFEFAEWMSSLINSNYKSNGNWYYNKEIYTTKQLYEKWMRNKIQGGNK